MNIITNDKMKCSLALVALKNVIDPEIGLNIIDLGLVYQLNFDEDAQKVFCSMTLTTPFCPMGESITEAVKIALESTFNQDSIDVDLTFEPTWNPEMISEEGKIFLNN